MFHKTLRLAIPYAQQLNQQGITLGLPQNSHLGSVLRFSSLDNPNAFTPVEDFIEGVRYATEIDGSISEHENFIGSLVDDLVPLVQNHIRISREVGALSTKLAEVVSKYYQSAPFIDASSNFNIIKDDVADFFDEAVIQGSLESKPIYNQSGIRPLVTGPRDPETIKDLLLTGNKRIDTGILTAVSSFGENFLQNLWSGLFMSPESGNPYNLDRLNILPAGERLLVCFLGYTIATKLFDQVPDDAIGSLSAFQSSCADVRDLLLSLAAVAYDERKQHIQNGLVVTGFNPNTRTATVVGSVYREWLEQGGSPEIILGCLIGDASSYSKEQLNESSERYIGLWKSYCIFHNAEIDVRAANFLRSSYVVAFTEMMGNIELFEEEFRKKNPGFAESAITSAQSYLESIGVEELKDFEKTSLHLMAGIRFGYTCAKLILEDIDQTMKTTPEVDVREAALVAAANYVALYQSTQITAGKR